jgi:hypothetical protein
MSAVIAASEPVPANAPDATPGKLMASINFYETPLGAMAIEALHAGEFDPNIQQHRLLQVIIDFLPQIVTPAEFAAAGSASTESAAQDVAEESTHNSGGESTGELVGTSVGESAADSSVDAAHKVTHESIGTVQ